MLPKRLTNRTVVLAELVGMRLRRLLLLLLPLLLLLLLWLPLCGHASP